MKPFIEFSLVVGCPNDCRYCPQDAHIKAYTGEKILSMDNYITMLDKLPKSVISIAGFSEPFMNHECTDMIEYATKKGHQVIIYTTLQGMTKDYYDRIRKNYGVTGFTLHLPDNEGNAKIKITEEYKELLKHIVINPPGQWQRFELSVHGSAVHTDISHIINVQNPVYRIHDRAGLINAEGVHKVHWISGKISCGNGFSAHESGLILPDGSVVACCMDFSLKYKLGNLLTKSWADIMKSDIRKSMKEDRETGCHDTICRHCAEAYMDYGR